MNNSLNKETIGGFGSLFDISNSKIKDPVIVSCTDGVGTKIELANKFAQPAMSIASMPVINIENKETQNLTADLVILLDQEARLVETLIEQYAKANVKAIFTNQENVAVMKAIAGTHQLYQFQGDRNIITQNLQQSTDPNNKTSSRMLKSYSFQISQLQV